MNNADHGRSANYRGALKRLMEAVEAFGEAKYLDDEEEIDSSGLKVEKALKAARKILALDE